MLIKHAVLGVAEIVSGIDSFASLLGCAGFGSGLARHGASTLDAPHGLNSRGAICLPEPFTRPSGLLFREGMISLIPGRGSE